MPRPIVVFGAILTLVSLLLTWWFSYYNTSSFHSSGPLIASLSNSSNLVYNVSPVMEGTSPGVPIKYTTFGINYSRASFLLPVAVLLLLIGGIVGIVGGMVSRRPSIYELIGSGMVFGAIVAFIALLVYTGGPSLLYGSLNIYGLHTSWGLGPGLFVALAGAIVMLLSHWQRGKGERGRRN